MVLETADDHEFYLAKAEEHPLLEEVIVGKTTLRDRFDELLDTMEQESSSFKKGSPHLEGFKDYLRLLAELSWHYVAEPSYRYVNQQNAQGNAEALVNYKSNRLVVGGSGLAAVVGAVLWFLPPLNILEYLLFTSGWARSALSFKSFAMGQKAKNNRAAVFSDVYAAADVVDEKIDRAFILESFGSTRPRFEQTYATLIPEELEQVDAQLYDLLGAGGIKGMDEIQLNDYLTGLLAPDGDA